MILSSPELFDDPEDLKNSLEYRCDNKPDPVFPCLEGHDYFISRCESYGKTEDECKDIARQGLQLYCDEQPYREVCKRFLTTTTTTTTTTTESDKTALIVGGLIGGGVFLIIVCLIVFFVCRKRRNNQSQYGTGATQYQQSRATTRRATTTGATGATGTTEA